MGAAKKKLSSSQSINLAIKLPESDNFSINEEFLRKLEHRAGFLTMVDASSDIVGGNAVCPFFFSAYEDALQQLPYLLGKRIICNPVFHRVEEFRKLLEEVYEQDSSSKILFIVPMRNNPDNPWFKTILEGKKWGLLEVYSRDAKTFYGPTKENIYSFGMR